MGAGGSDSESMSALELQWEQWYSLYPIPLWQCRTPLNYCLHRNTHESHPKSTWSRRREE